MAGESELATEEEGGVHGVYGCCSGVRLCSFVSAPQFGYAYLKIIVATSPPQPSKEVQKGTYVVQ
jgi:hypothetical protein